MTKRYHKYGQTHRTIKGRKQKYCATCRHWKGESEYYKQRSDKDGLAGKCRECSYTPVTKSHK